MPAEKPSSVSNVADLIQLPRFDAAGAVELGEALLAVAGEVPELPGSLKRAKDALEEDLAALRGAAAARLAAAVSAAAATDQAAIAAADRALDACWTALHDLLSAFTKLPDGIAQKAEAGALLDAIFPDGLSFILLPHESEWEQSEQRLLRIAEDWLADRIQRLGGGVLVETLAAAHAAYGKALGLPRPPGEKADGATGVAKALDAFVATLRVYTIKVTAHVEIGEPQTAVLASALLEPLLHYHARYSR